MGRGRRKQRKRKQSEKRNKKEIEQAKLKANDKWEEKKKARKLRTEERTRMLLGDALAGTKLFLREDQIQHNGASFDYYFIGGTNIEVRIDYRRKSFDVTQEEFASQLQNFINDNYSPFSRRLSSRWW
jgi:hypothetical protein